MRLIDVVVRGGHLSDRALAEALYAAERPAHIDQCDICAERAVRLSEGLNHASEMAVAVSDAAFPPEQLAAQRAQILRRLEQLDHAPRVISFPNAQPAVREPRDHRVAPAWLAVATAAGVVLGVVGGHLLSSSRPVVAIPPAPVAASTAPPSSPLPVEVPSSDVVLSNAPVSASADPALYGEVDRPEVQSIAALAALTPRQVHVQLVSLNGPVR